MTGAAPEVEHAYTQAHTLCQQVGETPELVPVLFGLWRFYGMRRQLHTARELGETLLRLAQHADDPALAVIAHYALGWTWFSLARCLLPARTWRKASHATRQTSAVPGVPHGPKIRGCPPSMPRDPLVAGVPGASPNASTRPWRWRTSCRIPIVWRCAVLGGPRLAVSPGRAGRARAGRGRRRALDRAGISTLAAVGTILGGRWPCRARREEGMAQVRQGIAAWRATGAALFVPYLCTVLAEVSAHLGHTEDGLQALAEAYTLVEQHEERWWEAEVCRLGASCSCGSRGRRRRRRNLVAGALDVARRQEANRWSCGPR